MYNYLKNKIKNFPDSPGIYIMKSKDEEVLYVGKASSLKKRVRSYFSSKSSYKTNFLLEKISDIEYVECMTEAQAFILEASLIKEKKPKYNIALRDDKSYPYVVITKEEFPRVFVARPKNKTDNLLFGPYPKVKLLKAALNMIRKVFPYCSCKGSPKKPCLFFHLKLCPAPCAGIVSSYEYRENIEGICRILRGERKELREKLRRKMEESAKQEKFEEAKVLRDKLVTLDSLYEGKGEPHEILALKNVLNLSTLPLSIEAIDISSLGWQSAAGSVVVFRDGIPDKFHYRRYRIKDIEKIDDYAMIGEVVRRRYLRLKKEGKELPDLIIIDGGKGHVEKAKEELDKLNLSISVIGVAKRNEEIWFPDKNSPLIIPKDNPCLHLVQRIRDEAHRFAHKYHLLRRRKKLINT